MAEPDPVLLELAALVRGALVLADRHRLHRVAVDLDSALLNLVALDHSGAITPQPFELDEGDAGAAGASYVQDVA